MPDIFISYSSKDREQALLLIEMLASAGLSVWIDQSGIGAATSWSGEIVDAIVLPDGSPFPHGMSVWHGYIYWVDDIGNGIAPVCRTKI